MTTGPMSRVGDAGPMSVAVDAGMMYFDPDADVDVAEGIMSIDQQADQVAAEGIDMCDCPSVEAEPLVAERYNLSGEEMSSFRDWWNENPPESNEQAFQTLQEADGEAFKDGEILQALKHLQRNLTPQKMDWGDRGTASTGESWFRPSGGSMGKEKEYFLDTSLWGAIFTDSPPLCRNIKDKFFSKVPELLRDLERDFDRQERKTDISKWDEKTRRGYEDQKQACLEALGTKSAVKYGGMEEDLKEVCSGAMRVFDPKEEAAPKPSLDDWFTSGGREDKKAPPRPSELVNGRLDNVFGNVSWDNWLNLLYDSDKCPEVFESSRFARIGYGIVGGGGTLTIVLLRLRNVFTFTGVLLSLFGLKPLTTKVILPVVKRLWSALFPPKGGPGGIGGGGEAGGAGGGEGVEVAKAPADGPAARSLLEPEDILDTALSPEGILVTATSYYIVQSRLAALGAGFVNFARGAALAAGARLSGAMPAAALIPDAPGKAKRLGDSIECGILKGTFVDDYFGWSTEPRCEEWERGIKEAMYEASIL